MKINMESNGGNIEGLYLGVQTNRGNVEKQSLWLAKAWAPSKAKSFTILNLVNTDYHGNPSPVETGYARFLVNYFTTKKEGKILWTSIN